MHTTSILSSPRARKLPEDKRSHGRQIGFGKHPEAVATAKLGTEAAETCATMCAHERKESICSALLPQINITFSLKYPRSNIMSTLD